MSGLILVVDDQLEPRRLLIDELAAVGFAVVAASDGEEAWDRFCADDPDLVITDMAMPRCDGLELLRRIRSRSETPVIVFSGYGSVATTSDAFKAGADEFVSSLDADIDDLVKLACNWLRNSGAPLALPDLERRIAGNCDTMIRIRGQLTGLAPLGTPVLVSGEPGSGRQSVIAALHELGSSAQGSLTRIDASTFTPPCQASLTGAIHLVDVEDLSPDAQIYWLDRIQNAELNAYRERSRIFASTTRIAAELARAGFHPGLLGQLLRFHVALPSLQSRAPDIPILAQLLLQRIGERLGRRRVRLSPAALAFLTARKYPGNVAELEQILERATAFTRGKVIRRDGLKDVIDDSQPSIDSIRNQANSIMRQDLVDAIRQSGGNISRAATRLGKSRSALYRMMHKYDIPIQHAD